MLVVCWLCVVTILCIWLLFMCFTRMVLACGLLCLFVAYLLLACCFFYDCLFCDVCWMLYDCVLLVLCFLDGYSLLAVLLVFKLVSCLVVLCCFVCFVLACCLLY